jgi:hypothetical protein
VNGIGKLFAISEVIRISDFEYGECFIMNYGSVGNHVMGKFNFSVLLHLGILINSTMIHDITFEL